MAYMLPCMKGILPEVYLRHAGLLVGAVYLLNKQSITTQDLEESKQLLEEFHLDYVTFYGNLVTNITLSRAY